MGQRVDWFQSKEEGQKEFLAIHSSLFVCMCVGGMKHSSMQVIWQHCAEGLVTLSRQPEYFFG